MNEIASDDWRATIAFRDYLRQHPDLAPEYADLKLALARQFPGNRLAYLAGKNAFIRRIVRLALAS
jgi:GrpB-like predicted nucleotidyltransferase (UPF0157 family)